MNEQIETTIKKFILNNATTQFDDCDLLYKCFEAIDCNVVNVIDFANAFLVAYNKYFTNILPLEDFDFNSVEEIVDLFNAYVHHLNNQ